MPTALTAIVSAIDGLSDVPVEPMHHSRVVPMPAGARDTTTPFGSIANSSTHYISPADFAVIYNLTPAYNSGINGTGQKIAVMGRSRIDPADITAFEKVANLPSTQPNVIVPPGGVDPGVTNTPDQDEATLDFNRVLGTAPGAQIDLVIANSASGGIQTAAKYEVSNLLDPVMNISFGSCETNSGQSGVTFWDTLFAQAAAEGISVFVSSGDAGAASCQTAGKPPSGVQARSINVICASSYVTCVGGTQFSDIASPSTYWNAANSTGLESAISYIPEGAWNEPTTTVNGATTFVLAATGGGASAFVTKPSWQNGTGVPNDGVRDVPDVSFSASSHNGYITCLTYKNAGCGTSASLIAGTSASAPSMAGIAAMLNQKAGGSQGNLNPFLYRLAASTPAAFHDATPGTSAVTCDINTASVCNNSTPSVTGVTGGLAGFALTPGYDQVTGLGSMDVSTLLNASSSAESLTVTPAERSLSLAAGATTGDQLTVSSAIFGGNVALGCIVTFNGTGSAASMPICSITPSSVNVSASGSATSTLTIATSARTAASLIAPPAHPANKSHQPMHLREAFAGMLFFSLLATRRSRRVLLTLRSTSLACLLLVGLGTLTACSGSSTPISPNPLLASGTNTSLALAAPTIFAGGSGTFTASVVNSGFNTVVAPTGSVRFFVNGGATPVATVALTGATATTTLPFPTAGTYTVVAVYAGDANFSTSTSAGSNLTVIPTGTTAGSYTVTITATAVNGPTASTAVALMIQ